MKFWQRFCEWCGDSPREQTPAEIEREDRYFEWLEHCRDAMEYHLNERSRDIKA